MPKIEHYIKRSPQLAAQLTGMMERRGLSLEQVVQSTSVSLNLAHLILDSDFHKDKRISKAVCAEMIAFVAGSDKEEFEACQEAGIEMFLFPGSDGAPAQIVKLL